MSQPELRSPSGWKLLVPFALLPILIVGAAVGVFFLFGVLADRNGAADYMHDLKMTSGSRRWQAAYELSRFLASGVKPAERAPYEEDLLGLLKSSEKSEVQLRRYLLVGIAQVGGERSALTLVEFLDTKPDSETEIFTLWALGRLGSHSARSAVLSRLNSEDAGIRKTAAFSLGNVGGKEDVSPLKKLLEDPVKDVRWNAALGLAQLGDVSGAVEIQNLLDPAYVAKETPELRTSERTQILMSAVNAVGRLKLASAKEAVQKLADHSTDPALRMAARNTVDALR